MRTMKKNSKQNKQIEEAVMAIAKLEKKYGKALYFAARRYNDRIIRDKKSQKK